ncbi:hypothetical protein [Sphingomonas adhaesiva]|uniref:hypothetical protein n=1 Tax=Sphingomonas adhaesiva TaxID=28212 RepID=UPI002FF758EB
MARTPTRAAASTASTTGAPAGTVITGGDITTTAGGEITAPTDTPAPPVALATDTSELVEVRVLTAFGDYQPNDVALVTPAQAQSDHVDADPDAVAYARSLKVDA